MKSEVFDIMLDILFHRFDVVIKRSPNRETKVSKTLTIII